ARPSPADPPVMTTLAAFLFWRRVICTGASIFHSGLKRTQRENPPRGCTHLALLRFGAAGPPALSAPARQACSRLRGRAACFNFHLRSAHSRAIASVGWFHQIRRKKNACST